MKFKVFLIFCLIFSSLTTLSSVSATDDINQTDEFLDDSDDNVFDSVNHTQLLYNDSSDDVELVLDNMSEFNDFYKEDVQFNSKVNDSSLEIKSNFSIADDMSVSSNSAYLSTTLAGDDLKFYYKNGKYVAILKDSYGNSLSNKNVVITVSGVSYTKVTDSLGKASLNINLNPGTYPISAVFKGDSVYKSSSVSNTLTIMSTLEGSNLVKSYRNASQFYVRAYLNTGGFLKNKNLSMDIKGVIYQRATDEAGLARLNINLDPGTYIITVTNLNDGLKYSYNITIVKEDVVLSADNFVINRVGEYYQAKLTDKYGHALVNKTINIVANGVSYSRITDSNGIAKLKINYNTVAAYTVYCTFSGDVGYNGIITSTKTINRVSSSTKLNVNLLVNDTLFKQKGEYIYGILKDNNGFPMANYQVKYIVNGVTYTSTTDSEGVAKTSINLNSGKYTLNSIFAGSTYYNSVQKNNIITMDFTPNVAYSFKVPMYVNVTGLTVSKSYSNSKYVMEEGVNGIVKVPTTRTFSINLNNVQYNFASGYGKTEYDNGLYTLLNQDSYFISSDGVKTKVNNNYVPSVSGVLIKDDSDYVSLFYYGVVSPNNVSQFSTVFTPSGRGADFAKETMRVIINGKEVTKITFSEALPYYDEHGLKLQLNKGQSLLNGVDVYEVPYSSLPSTNLKYSATNVSLEYRLSETRIFNNPRADTLQMILNVSGVLFERFETFEYAYSNYNSLYGFEIVQSYALADRNVKDSDIQYWLNQKSNFAEGYMKSTYGTFLNALSVFWLSDKYASSLSDYYDVDWSRDGFFIILSGVESGYKSYINSLDPTLGRLIQGADNNTHAFSFMNSLILSEIENVILKGCGHSVDSPISFILNAFLSGESLDLIPVNESSAVILKLSDNDNFYIMIDLENFIVHGVFSNGSQIYKGAYSISDSGCYHDYLSDELVSFLSSFVGNFLDAFMDPYILLGTFGGLAITAGFVAAGPFGWGVALGLIAGGLILNAASSHLFDNFGKVNAGYTDLENWLDFGVGAFISVLGAKPAYTAGKSAYKAAKLTISSEMKDYSSKTKITSRRLSYSPKSIEENLKRYTFENRVSDVYRCTLGETKTDIVLKILKEHSNGSFVSAFLDEVKV